MWEYLTAGDPELNERHGVILNFIDGEYRQGRSGRTFDDINPADGSLIDKVSEAAREDVDDAVRAAHAALAGPVACSSSLRNDATSSTPVAAEIDRRGEDFIAAEVADTGKPRSLASHLDIPRGAANFRVFADVVRNVATETFTGHAPDGKPALNYACAVQKGSSR